MNHPKRLCALLLACLACATPASAQEKGIWHAESKTAKSVTGDISFSDVKVNINFYNFTIANIRALTPAELSAAFDADPATQAVGTLYRLVIPGSKKFLHGSTLCGAEDTQWIATFVSGRKLQLIFFSGNNMPVFTVDALPNSSDLCGVYTYTR